jgi:hypothetical protein
MTILPKTHPPGLVHSGPLEIQAPKPKTHSLVLLIMLQHLVAQDRTFFSFMA